MNFKKYIFSKLKYFYRAVALLKRGYQPSVNLYVKGKIKSPSLKKRQNVGNDWEKYKNIIINEFLEKPMNFLRQPIISRILHPNQQSLADSYLKEMAEDKFAQNKILLRLHDVPIGDPYVCETFPLASPLSIQHAWYILMMHKYLGFFFPNSKVKYVYEFGGGYGNFCRLTYNFGYSGSYTIVDHPEIQYIQKHFLEHVYPEKVSNKQIEFLEFSESKILSRGRKHSLFIATFSLNETPLNLRNEVEIMLKDFDYIFLAFNSSWGGINNVEYFEGFRDRLANQFDFKLVKDYYRKAWFLIGQRHKISVGNN